MVRKIGLVSKDIDIASMITDLSLDDTTGGTDGLLTKAPTSNVMYDHGVATTGVHGVGAGTIAKTSDIPTIETAPTDSATKVPSSSYVFGITRKNAIINGGFTINQRAYVSAAALATTVYGHDRWKAGAGGGDYSFTQLASPTTITIAANKTLIQVIENKMVYGGTYILSWAGTCQARYAINSATPAGAYAASPIIITGQTAGTTMSVEFGNGASSGTLGLVQLELNSVATPFEFRPYQQELALCQRYCISYRVTASNQRYGLGSADTTSSAVAFSAFPVEMRAVPTLTTSAMSTFAYNGVTPLATLVIGYSTNKLIAVLITVSGTPLTVGRADHLWDQGGASFMVYSAEL